MDGHGCTIKLTLTHGKNDMEKSWFSLIALVIQEITKTMYTLLGAICNPSVQIQVPCLTEEIQLGINFSPP